MDGLKGLFPINESSTFLSINLYRNKYLWRTWAIYEHIRWLFHRLHTSVGESSCKLCPSPLNTSIWYLPSSSITGTLQGDIYPAYEQSSWACRACLFLQEPITCIQEQSKTDCPFPCTNLQNKERETKEKTFPVRLRLLQIDFPHIRVILLNDLIRHGYTGTFSILDQIWIHTTTSSTGTRSKYLHWITSSMLSNRLGRRWMTRFILDKLFIALPSTISNKIKPLNL